MNTEAICELSKLLSMESENMSQLACSVETPNTEKDLIEDMMLDCVCHIQAIAIELTKEVAGEAREDDGVFAPGDLESVKTGEED